MKKITLLATVMIALFLSTTYVSADTTSSKDKIKTEKRVVVSTASQKRGIQISTDQGNWSKIKNLFM